MGVVSRCGGGFGWGADLVSFVLWFVVVGGWGGAAVGFWGASSGCVWNYCGVGDSPFPVIAGQIYLLIPLKFNK